MCSPSRSPLPPPSPPAPSRFSSASFIPLSILCTVPLLSYIKGCTCSFFLLAFSFLQNFLLLFSLFLSMIHDILMLASDCSPGSLVNWDTVVTHTAPASFLLDTIAEYNLGFPAFSVSIKFFYDQIQLCDHSCMSCGFQIKLINLIFFPSTPTS